MSEQEKPILNIAKAYGSIHEGQLFDAESKLHAEQLKSAGLQESIDGCAKRVQALAAENEKLKQECHSLSSNLDAAIDDYNVERERANRLETERSHILGELLQKQTYEGELRVALASATLECASRKKWIDDLLSGGYVNCVYCGHRYGPSDETPVSKADMLKAHIEECPEHPMSVLKTQLQEALKRLASAEAKVDTMLK